MEIRTEKVLLETGGALDGSAASGGFIVPRIATASLPQAGAALKGCLVYDSTANKLLVCTGSAWETVTSAS